MTYYPTNCYPGAYWGSSRQMESLLPAVAAPPQFQEIAPDNYAFAGNREIVRIRSEERRALRLSGIDALEAEQWRQFFTQHAAVGSQCELLVDRFTGKTLTFADTIVDQNTEASSSTGTLSYQWVGAKRGALCAAGAVAHFPVNASSVNASVTASEGVIVVSAVCSFAGNDGITKYFWHWGETATRLALVKESTSQVFATWVGPDAVERKAIITSASWPSGSTVTAITRWTQGGTLDLWLFVQGSAMARATASLSGATLTGISSRFAVGAFTDDSAPMSKGVLLHFATYKKAFDDPTVLASHFPLGMNYFPRAELLDKVFMPKRLAATTDVWEFSWTFRNGLTTW